MDESLPSHLADTPFLGHQRTRLHSKHYEVPPAVHIINNNKKNISGLHTEGGWWPWNSFNYNYKW